MVKIYCMVFLNNKICKKQSDISYCLFAIIPFDTDIYGRIIVECLSLSLRYAI